MNKQLLARCLLVVFVCISVLTGCTDKPVVTQDNPTTHHNTFKSVEPVGQIPDALKTVVANNLFRGAVAFDGRLLKVDITFADEEFRSVTQKVRMMDVYGNDLAAYTCNSDCAYHVTTLTATEDGGFLFVLGFDVGTINIVIVQSYLSNCNNFVVLG